MVGKVWLLQEHEAMGEIASAGSRDHGMLVPSWLSPFCSVWASQSMRWCCPHSRWVFPPELTNLEAPLQIPQRLLSMVTLNPTLTFKVNHSIMYQHCDLNLPFDFT